MKRYYVALLFCLFQTMLFGKENSYDDEKGKIVKTGDIILENTVYNWTYSILESKLFQFEIKKGDLSKKFTISALEYEVFRVSFNQSVSEIDTNLNNKIGTYEAAAKIFITLKLFFEQTTNDRAPIAGYLSIPLDSTSAYFYEDPKDVLDQEIQNQQGLINLNMSKKNTLIIQLKKITEDTLIFKSQNNQTNLYGTNQKIKELKDITDSLQRDISMLSSNLNRLYARKKNYKREKDTDTRQWGSFHIDSIKTEFSEGAIKNIIAFGVISYYVPYYLIDTTTKKQYSTYKRILIPIMLRNFYPIPFASLRDYTVSDIKLWEFPSYYNHDVSRINKDWYVYFSDVVKYRPELTINQEDYSPRDGVNTFKSGYNQPVYKELNSNLFRVKVFSDFVGIKDDNPNGLIQSELSKKIIINPKKIPFLAFGHRPNVLFGTFNFIEPIFSLSKIEENNKYLPLNQISKQSNLLKEGEIIKSSANILDLYRYQNFSAGINFNVASFDIPIAKSSFFFNFGTKIFRTAVVDTVRMWKNGNIISTNNLNKYNTNNFLLSSELLYQVKPDTRFGFQISFKTSWIRVLNENIVPIYNSNLSLNDQRNNQNIILTTQLDAFIKPSISNSNTGEIFARLSYNSPLFNGKQNFMQIQIGYAFNLLKKDS